MTNTHPDTESLLGFIDAPDAEDFQAVSLHLASCAECRGEVSRLNHMLQSLDDTLIALENPSEPLDTQKLLQIKRYVNKEMPNAEAKQFAQSLQQDKHLLKASLHYASHAAAMQDSVAPPAPAPPQAVKQNRAGARDFRDYLAALVACLQLRPPVWATAGITAALVLGLSFSFSNFMPRQAANNIVAYQDNPVVVFKQAKDNRPGIGFFSGITTSTSPFTQISIQRTGSDSLQIKWPVVDNAQQYVIRLYQVRHGQRNLLREQTVLSNFAEFEKLSLVSVGRYEWQISGHTSTQKSFKASGGFVVSK